MMYSKSCISWLIWACSQIETSSPACWATSLGDDDVVTAVADADGNDIDWGDDGGGGDDADDDDNAWCEFAAVDGGGGVVDDDDGDDVTVDDVKDDDNDCSNVVVADAIVVDDDCGCDGAIVVVGCGGGDDDGDDEDKNSGDDSNIDEGGAEDECDKGFDVVVFDDNDDADDNQGVVEDDVVGTDVDGKDVDDCRSEDSEGDNVLFVNGVVSVVGDVSVEFPDAAGDADVVDELDEDGEFEEMYTGADEDAIDVSVVFIWEFPELSGIWWYSYIV